MWICPPHVFGHQILPFLEEKICNKMFSETEKFALPLSSALKYLLIFSLEIRHYLWHWSQCIDKCDNVLSFLCQTLGKFRSRPVDSLTKEQTVLRFQNFNNRFILLLCTQPSAISDKHVDLKLLTSLKQNALGSYRINNHIQKSTCWGQKAAPELGTELWLDHWSPNNANATWASKPLWIHTNLGEILWEWPFLWYLLHFLLILFLEMSQVGVFQGIQ